MNDSLSWTAGKGIVTHGREIIAQVYGGEKVVKLVSAAREMREALEYQAWVDANPEAVRNGYHEKAARMRNAALAKAQGEV